MLQEQHVIFCEYIIRRTPESQIFNIWRLLYFTATAAGTVATVGTATAVASAVVGDADVVAVVVIVAMRK